MDYWGAWVSGAAGCENDVRGVGCGDQAGRAGSCGRLVPAAQVLRCSRPLVCLYRTPQHADGGSAGDGQVSTRRGLQAPFDAIGFAATNEPSCLGALRRRSYVHLRLCECARVCTGRMDLMVVVVVGQDGRVLRAGGWVHATRDRGGGCVVTGNGGGSCTGTRAWVRGALNEHPGGRNTAGLPR